MSVEQGEAAFLPDAGAVLHLLEWFGIGLCFGFPLVMVGENGVGFTAVVFFVHAAADVGR